MESSSSNPAERCESCGAALGKNVEWCGQCFTAVEKPEPPRRFAAPDAFLGPPMPKHYSRWAKTDVSYGPAGRIAATILLGVVPLVLLLLFMFPMAAIWLFAVLPFLLPAIWKKTPIRDREPPD